MRKLKNIIIVLLIFILIISVILIIILNKQKQDLPIIEESEIPQDTQIELAKNTIKEENDYIFFTINDIIQKMIKKENAKYYAQEMYKIQNYEYANYYIYGIKEDKDSKSIEQCYVKLDIDYNNNTFKAENSTQEEYQKAKEGKTTKITQQQIEKSQNNSYEVALYNSREIAKRYIQDYLMKLQYSLEDAFSLLEEQCKNQKFKNIEDFKKYIQENNNRFTNFEIQSCKSEIKEDSTEYTVLDQLDKSYKIIVYDTLNYKIILDNI